MHQIRFRLGGALLLRKGLGREGKKGFEGLVDTPCSKFKLMKNTMNAIISDGHARVGGHVPCAHS